VAITDGERESLLSHVPEDRGIGNTALMRVLGWEADRYWAVRDVLLDDGVIERGRGQGGSVRRVAASPETFDVAAKEMAVGETAIAFAREAELYEPMRRVIETAWAKDHKTDPIAVVVTAAQGRRQTGGRWTRPDIVSVAVKTFRYLPGKYLEIVTFEVKPADAWDVTAVYEALAHLRSATHAYVVLHVPDSRPADLEKTVDELCRVARSHGIGVIVAGDPSDYATWEEHEDAIRREPDPQLLDDFIAAQLSSDVKERISRHLH
jgi:hypothetical protein